MLEGAAFKHARVLRVARGDTVRVVDGSGAEYACRVEEISSRSVWVEVLERRDLAPEPHRRVHLYCGLLKGEKLDLVLQKCTELGVAAVTFFASSRTVARADGRVERWLRIVASAAAQCGRASLPAVAGPLAFEDALGEAASAEPAVLLWEGADGETLSSLLRQHPDATRVALLVGPEGGFSAAEAEAARAAGIHVASLGRRILRAETAALIAPALCLFASGDLG